MQRKANRRVSKRENLSPRLLWSLAHEPVWFGGILAVIAGFLLQATALGNGQLSVVEPILVLELPATLILASRVFGSRMHRREWGSAAVMTVGLAGMLYFLSPSAGRPQSVRWYAWVIGIGINLAGRGRPGCLGRGATRRSRPDGRSGQRAAGGPARGRGRPRRPDRGADEGYDQDIHPGVRGAVHQLAAVRHDRGGHAGHVPAPVGDKRGPADRRAAGADLSDPIVSILWGVFVFSEHVRGGWYVALAVIGGLVMAAAVVVLARSPLLSSESGQQAQSGQEAKERRQIRGREH